MRITAAIVFCLLPYAGYAQTPKKLEFEVAILKTFDPQNPNPASGPHPPMSGGPGTSDPERISFRLDLRKLLMQAYSVRADQIAGPDWIRGATFDIVAKVPAGATKDQANVMLQNLLLDRFGMKIHHEMRDAPAYAMTVAKGGSKLKETAYPNASPDAPASLAFALDKNDFPILPKEAAFQMRANWIKNDSMRSTFRAFTMDRLAQEVQGALPDFMATELGGLPPRVVNRTGLTGAYDFTLEYADHSDADANGPSIFSAVEKQLGLKLDKINLPQDVIVIDHAEKTPQEN